MKQLSLIPKKEKDFHGGSLQQNRRKIQRPLCRKRSMHLVLKCYKRQSLFENKKLLQTLIKKYGKKFGIKVYSLSIQHDHVHSLIRISNREGYVKFIRSLTGQMARKLEIGLFKFLPFTRIVEWGRAYKKAQAYLQKNEDEVHGRRTYEPRKNYYDRFLDTG